MYKTIIVAVLSLMLAGPVAGQQRTTTDEQVRTMLDDLRDWPPDSQEIPKKRARKWSKNKRDRERYARLFAEGGDLQSIDFIEAFDGGDMYMVEFENARVMIRYRREPKKRYQWGALMRVPR